MYAYTFVSLCIIFLFYVNHKKNLRLKYPVHLLYKLCIKLIAVYFFSELIAFYFASVSQAKKIYAHRREITHDDDRKFRVLFQGRSHHFLESPKLNSRSSEESSFSERSSLRVISILRERSSAVKGNEFSIHREQGSASAKNADAKDVSERKRSKRAKRRPRSRKSSHFCVHDTWLPGDDTRVNGDTICSIGHYDYYDQVTATRRERTEGGNGGPALARQVVLLMNYRYYLSVCACETHRNSRTKWDGKRPFRFGKDRRVMRSRDIPTNEEMERKQGKFSARD